MSNYKVFPPLFLTHQNYFNLFAASQVESTSSRWYRRSSNASTAPILDGWERSVERFSEFFFSLPLYDLKSTENSCSLSSDDAERFSREIVNFQISMKFSTLCVQLKHRVYIVGRWNSIWRGQREQRVLKYRESIEPVCTWTFFSPPPPHSSLSNWTIGKKLRLLV